MTKNLSKNLSKLDTYVVLHFHNQRYNYILPYEVANAIYKELNWFNTTYDQRGGHFLKFHAIYAEYSASDVYLNNYSMRERVACFWGLAQYIAFCENRSQATRIKYDCDKNIYNLPPETLKMLQFESQNISK